MKLLLYCTKGKPYLKKRNQSILDNGIDKYIQSQEITLNGKIVAECDYEVEEIYYLSFMNEKLRQRIYKESCLSDEEISNYMNRHDTMYAIHIKNLHIFDKLIELNELYNDEEQLNEVNSLWDFYGMPDYESYEEIQIKKAPQNMMYAYSYTGEKYVLISIHPEHLCKILNGEKTIEVRRRVLKGMI